MARRPGRSWERGLDVSRKKKSSHEQTGRAASHTQGKLPLQITHAQGDKTRGASAPREEREGREMEGKLDTGTLCNELVSVSDWRKLGLNLSIRDYELDKIERSHSAEGCDGWKRETFSLWLRCTPSASWGDVVGALQQMGEKTVAERIEQKYIQKGPPSTGTPSPTKPESPSLTNRSTEAVTRRNIVLIQGKFSTLVTTSCTRLRGRNINIEDFQTYLITMYSSPDSRDGSGIVITVVKHAKSLAEIFQALSEYQMWDYLNY